MKKSILLGAVLVCGLALAGCGNSQSSKDNSSSNSRSEKVAKSSSVVSSSSNSMSSSSSSEKQSTPTTTVNNKQAGVMLALLVDPDWFKEYIGDDVMSYVESAGSDMGEQVKGYSYITANGDPTSYIYYKVNGDTVSYKQWVPSNDGGVANGHFESNSVSLSRLENDYYVNQSQKDEVNQYVNELK